MIMGMLAAPTLSPEERVNAAVARERYLQDESKRTDEARAERARIVEEAARPIRAEREARKAAAFAKRTPMPTGQEKP